MSNRVSMSVITKLGDVKNIEDSSVLYNTLEECSNVDSSWIREYPVVQAAFEAVRNKGIVFMSHDFGCSAYLFGVKPTSFENYWGLESWYKLLPKEQRNRIKIAMDDVEDNEVYSAIITVDSVEHFYEF